ncbi:hypothetical protein BGZ98_008901 [Dissophora globulifera]|nr:hypothetical protein BGZ98_008901 [Dissophora globulifera]
MTSDRNRSRQPESTGEAPPINNSHNNDNNDGFGNRPIFTLTVDPNAIEHELDQAAQALHSTFNSLFNTMQSSVFGGLESLSKEMSVFEKSSKEYLKDHPLQNYQHHFSQIPWNFRMDGPKKRYRITIEELSPADEVEASSSRIFSTSSSDTESSRTLVKGKSDDEDITIAQGKAGTVDEGKTVITASVAPGLLDWLLFTTHEDSFFRRLGQSSSNSATTTPDEGFNDGGAKIQELRETELTKEDQEAARKRVVPALVEKVKQVGTSWENDARHWWQRKREDNHSEQGSDQHQRHHLFVGTSQQDEDQEEGERRWPRRSSWGRAESFAQTTVTRPDGTVEQRVVKSINGETETVVKIQHPDGSIEETVTRESQQNHGHGGGFRDRWTGRRRLETDEDRERDSIAAVVAEAIAVEKQEQQKQEQEQDASGKPKSWPPKAWMRRQERDE